MLRVDCLLCSTIKCARAKTHGQSRKSIEKVTPKARLRGGGGCRSIWIFQVCMPHSNTQPIHLRLPSSGFSNGENGSFPNLSSKGHGGWPTSPWVYVCLTNLHALKMKILGSGCRQMTAESYLLRVHSNRNSPNCSVYFPTSSRCIVNLGLPESCHSGSLFFLPIEDRYTFHKLPFHSY